MTKKSRKHSGNGTEVSKDQSAAGNKVFVSTDSKMKLGKRTYAVLAVALVLLVVASAALYIASNDSEPDDVNEREVSATEATQQAHELETSGDFRAAIAAYNDAVESSTGSEKAELLSAQATIALRNGALDEALEYAKSADQANSTADSQSLLGAIAKQQGDNGAALEYYKRALELYRESEMRDESEEQALSDIITELETAGQ